MECQPVVPVPYCGWTKSCTTWKPWLKPFVCWYLQGNLVSHGFQVVQGVVHPQYVFGSFKEGSVIARACPTFGAMIQQIETVTHRDQTGLLQKKGVLFWTPFFCLSTGGPRGSPYQILANPPPKRTTVEWAGHPDEFYGSKLSHQGTAGFGPCYCLAGFHFGCLFLTHSHLIPGSRHPAEHVLCLATPKWPTSGLGGKSLSRYEAT